MKEKEQEASLNVVSCVDMAEGCINIGIDAMAEAKDTEGVIAAALFSIAYSMVAMNKMKMEEMETVKAEVEGRAVNVIEDTIALPKEQEDLGTELTNAVELIHKKNERIKKLLKEKDAVKPKYNERTNWYECGNCHYSMTSGMHCRSELIPATKVRYCANCGFPVNWEGR